MIFRQYKARLTIFVLALAASFNTSGAIDFFSTGIDDDGNLLSDGVQDPHYSLFYAGTVGNYGTAYVTTNNPNPWLSSGANYQWINPTGKGTDDLPCRDCNDPPAPDFSFNDYFYSTSFSLLGVDINAVYLEFDIAADNAVNIDINDRYIGRFDGFEAFQKIVLDEENWFVDGINTIRFGVANTANFSNPTGLMVRVVQARVPEPSVIMLVVLGLLGLKYAKNSRQKTAGLPFYGG